MKPEEMMAFVYEQVDAGVDLAGTCSALLDLCLEKGSRDNLSAILVRLQSSPPRLLPLRLHPPPLPSTATLALQVAFEPLLARRRAKGATSPSFFQKPE